MSNNVTPLLATLREQKAMKMKGGIYHKTQIDLTDTCLTAQDQYKAALGYFRLSMCESSAIGQTECRVGDGRLLAGSSHTQRVCLEYGYKQLRSSLEYGYSMGRVKKRNKIMMDYDNGFILQKLV